MTEVAVKASVSDASLESYVRQKRQEKNILLISHVVMGFLSEDVSYQSVESMVKAGVDIIELQIPFSEPQADGPYFTHANQVAVDNHTSLEQCFAFAETVCRQYPDTAFVFMTYTNILFRYGYEAFVKKAKAISIRGIIVPDLPIEEAAPYLDACSKYGIAPILMFTPTTTSARMTEIAAHAQGFIYAQARAGVTGSHTKFDNETLAYIKRCKEGTTLPIAMGFGIQTREDVTFLEKTGDVDIAICCTQAVKVLENDGSEAMGAFLERLR